MHLDLLAGTRVDGGAAAGTEMPSCIGPRLAADHDSVLREYRRGVEEGAMMLAAFQAMAEADPAGPSHRLDPDTPAQATASEPVRLLRGYRTLVHIWLRQTRPPSTQPDSFMLSVPCMLSLPV